MLKFWLLSENKTSLFQLSLTYLRSLTHQTYRPSTSREQSLPSFETSPKYISARDTDEIFPFNSISLQRKEIDTKRKGMRTKSSTKVITGRETSSNMRSNKTSENNGESQIGSLPNGKSIFPADTSILNSTKKKQLMDTSLRNKSSTGDDCKCFSVRKF